MKIIKILLFTIISVLIIYGSYKFGFYIGEEKFSNANSMSDVVATIFNSGMNKIAEKVIGKNENANNIEQPLQISEIDEEENTAEIITFEENEEASISDNTFNSVLLYNKNGDVSSEFNGNSSIKINLEWDSDTEAENKNIDIDLFAISTDKDGKCKDENIVYYNNLSNLNNSIYHFGDNRDKSEAMSINLSEIPEEIKNIVFVASIYNINENNRFDNLKDINIAMSIDDENIYESPINITGNENIIELITFSKTDMGWEYSTVSQGREESIEDYMRIYGLEPIMNN